MLLRILWTFVYCVSSIHIPTPKNNLSAHAFNSLQVVEPRLLFHSWHQQHYKNTEKFCEAYTFLETTYECFNLLTYSSYLLVVLHPLKRSPRPLLGGLSYTYEKTQSWPPVAKRSSLLLVKEGSTHIHNIFRKYLTSCILCVELRVQGGGGGATRTTGGETVWRFVRF